MSPFNFASQLNVLRRSLQLTTAFGIALFFAGACNKKNLDDAQISSTKLPDGVVGNPNCLSFVEIVETGSFGTTRRNMPRVKAAMGTFKGKDVHGRQCQITLKSTGVVRAGYQSINFSAQFSDVRLPEIFRNVGEADVGLDADSVTNGKIVESKMHELGYDPQLFSEQQPLMSFSTVFGPIPPAPKIGQPVRIIHVAISKQSCEPVYVMFNSNYPWEKKADLCIIDKTSQ